MAEAYTCSYFDVQVRTFGGAAQRPDRTSPERDPQPQTGAGQHGREDCLPVL